MATVAPTKAAPVKARIIRSEIAHTATLIGLIAVITVPAGIDAAFIAGDFLVGVAAAGMTMLVVIALLQALGILGGR